VSEAGWLVATTAETMTAPMATEPKRVNQRARGERR